MIKMTEQTIKQTENMNFKIFDLYDLSEIKIKDPGLKSAINLEPKLILRSGGRNVGKMGQLKVNVVERLMNRIAVAGHRSKKHKIELGHATGKEPAGRGLLRTWDKLSVWQHFKQRV